MDQKIQQLASLIQTQKKPCLIKTPDGKPLMSLLKKIPKGSYIEIDGKTLEISDLINSFKHSGFKVVIKKHGFSFVKLELEKESPLATNILGFTSKELHSYMPKEKPNVKTVKI